MGLNISKSSNNVPSSDTTNIILAKIYNSSCRTRSLKALIRNLNPVILMDLKAIMLKELLHNPKLNSSKFNRYACILAEIDETLNRIRRDSVANEVVRIPQRQASQSKPAREISQLSSPGLTANYNVTLCHSSSTDETVPRRTSSFNSHLPPPLPMPPPAPVPNYQTNTAPSAPAPPYSDFK